MSKSLLLFSLFFFFSSSVYSFNLLDKSSINLNLTGSYKNLFSTSNELATSNRYFSDLNRLRTSWDLTLFHLLKFQVVWDNEIVGGNFVNTAEFGQFLKKRNDPWPDLQAEIVQRKNFFYGQNLYRAFVQLNTPSVTLTAGRQKIEWGDIRLVSPVDLFNPPTIFNIEKEENQGITAANLVFIPTHDFKLNAVYSAGPALDDSRFGVKATKTIGNYNLSVLGGRFLRDAIVGGQISGEIKKAGVRAEFYYDHGEDDNHFIQFALEADYALTKKLYLDLEYFFNGEEPRRFAGFAILPRSANQIKSLHKHFVGMLLKYDFNPLVTATLLNVMDISGKSFFINPEIKYAPLGWLELAVGSQLPVGANGGEFTTLPNVYYTQAQIFF